MLCGQPLIFDVSICPLAKPTCRRPDEAKSESHLKPLPPFSSQARQGIRLPAPSKTIDKAGPNGPLLIGFGVAPISHPMLRLDKCPFLLEFKSSGETGKSMQVPRELSGSGGCMTVQMVWAGEP